MPQLGDGDLDLDELLGEKDAAHYRRFIRVGRNPFYIAPDPAEPATWRAYQVRSEELERSRPTDALIVEGWGPLTASSDTRLAERPEVCWDVLGYYRALGVHWRATRRQIATAYLLCGGPARRRLTYIVRQLMDPQRRREYDALPLGTRIWLKDAYIVTAIKKAAVAEAARRAAAGAPAEGEDVLREWGMQATDKPPGAAQPRSREPGPDDQEALPIHSPWGSLWSWYEQGDCDQPREWLPYWQALLIRVLAERGLRVRFAVGLTDLDTDVLILGGLSDGGRIVLLGSRPPSLQLAAKAVTEWQAADSADLADRSTPDARVPPWGRRS
jgi:hypothetical protein